MPNINVSLENPFADDCFANKFPPPPQHSDKYLWVIWLREMGCGYGLRDYLKLVPIFIVCSHS